MHFREIKIPSNKKFGCFLTVALALTAQYFSNKQNMAWTWIFTFSAVLSFCFTILNADALHNLNKLWMKFGLLLGIIFNPVVLGIIYFGLLTPIAFITRLIGRDELNLKLKKETSHWIARDKSSESTSFKFQF